MSTRRLRRFGGLTALLVLAGAGLAGSAQAAATIRVVNGDGPGEGFNDPTPAAPVGGNAGTTRGQQALNVFQAAADAWGKVLNSNVEIRILANFDPLQCTAQGAVLGQAGPVSVNADPSFPNPDTWYVAALADALTGVDQNAGANDISAKFNSQLGQGPCAAFPDWYYGLDGQSTGGNDLASTVLHEFGHGLGFLTLVNKTTGALFQNQPDAWLFFMKDKTQDKLWKDMTNAERVTSLKNTGNLLWVGEGTTAAAPAVLGPPARFAVLSPASLAGERAFGSASFGPPLTTDGVTGEVQLGFDSGPTGSPLDACEPLAPLTGKIALVERGVCGFTVKVKNAQDAGAIAVLVADNDPANVPPPGLGGTDPSITIPAVRISKADGDAFKVALDGGTVTVRLDRDATKLAGATDGFAQIYSPPVIATGSSGSHFTDVADPDLLMEPFSNRRNGLVGLDLTTPLFQDIGWPVSIDLAVAVSGQFIDVDAGQAVFTIDVINVGDGNAEGVSLANATPPGLTFVSTEGACTTAFPCALGTITVGASKTVTVTYALPPDYAEPSVVDEASVSSTTPDLAAANNVASFSLPVSGGPGGSGGGGSGGTGGVSGSGGSGGSESGSGGVGGISGTGGSGGGSGGSDNGSGGSGGGSGGSDNGSGGSGGGSGGSDNGSGGSGGGSGGSDNGSGGSGGGPGGSDNGSGGSGGGSGGSDNGSGGSGGGSGGSDNGSGGSGGGTGGSDNGSGGSGGGSGGTGGGSGGGGGAGSGTGGTGNSAGSGTGGSDNGAGGSGGGTAGTGVAGTGGTGGSGGGASGKAGTGGAAGKAGNSTTPGDDDDDGGCAVQAPGTSQPWTASLGFLAAALLLRRRRDRR